MSGSLFRRCGCRWEDAHGAKRQYAVLPERPTEAQREKACPLMADDKHGRWSYRLSAGIDPATGKRRQVNGKSFAGKREAQKARNEDAVKLDRGTWVKPSSKRLRDWLPEWLERRQRTDRALRPSSLENYTRYIEQDLAPSALGGMKLEDIRRSHVATFIDDLATAGRGAVTIRRIVAVLQGALSAAVSAELIPAPSPATRLGDVLPAVDKKRFEPWTPEQVGEFLDVASTHRLGALFEVAAFTGLRRSELLGLRWQDVDSERAVLRVKASKTDAGVRVVDLDDSSLGALMAWRLTQEAEAGQWGAAYKGSGHVFTYEDGSPLKLQYATRLFDKLRARAGLPEMTLHGLRHMSASLMLASGANIALVSKRLGHSSVQVTSDVYSHLIGSASRDAANAAASLVPRSSANAGAHTVHIQGGDDMKKAAPAVGGNGL